MWLLHSSSVIRLMRPELLQCRASCATNSNSQTCGRHLSRAGRGISGRALYAVLAGPGQEPQATQTAHLRIRVSLEHLGGTCKALVGLERAFPRTRPSVLSWLPSPSRTQLPSNCSFPHCVASGAASQQPHDITTPSRTARPLESSPDIWERPSWSQGALLLRSRVCSLSFLLNNHN